ncbi:hypothetical protein SAMN05421810_103120 [Amycolatopsis arida]|uniref:Uncharacterized protein n=1 Tax=Amycolatopsis arida TaxID=587909 RepID=A0A1I5SF20_9PSEU|nr:hypothetical protein [Amycolatopsis arida]TDX96496.1 hypothetical protein CLV69_103638 [Amycolatopsis arida]SFP69292.1 hypothetical protein SAMN05421810_103120 [Amycolatopsis arida]
MTDQHGEVTAAMRYKETIGLARKAADDLRSWELARAEELAVAIAAARAEVARAAEREEAMAERAHRWWRMAADNVDRVSWLTAGEPPEPVPSARGEWVDRYAEDVRPAYHELNQAILHLGWRAR